ncbi:MAG: hypothetical protein KME12_26415 [Trichocoleus desertorum ATA4-8-CV12]|jgi:hypothetical protein|nr:hypothetical protein [Trichocoleus desertorum ATA4-8-CV12]
MRGLDFQDWPFWEVVITHDFSPLVVLERQAIPSPQFGLIQTAIRGFPIHAVVALSDRV